MNQNDFRKELENLINSYSKENGSDTPDWILANYMDMCLQAYDQATNQREAWYGRGKVTTAIVNEGKK